MKLTAAMDVLALLVVFISTTLGAGFTSGLLQNQTVPAAANTTSADGNSTAEATGPGIAGTAPPPDFTFSPVWLKDVAVPPEEVEDRNSEQSRPPWRKEEEPKEDGDGGGDREVTVHESQYVNAGSEPLLRADPDVQSEELADEEPASSWHVADEPEDEYDDQELDDDDVVIHESLAEQSPIPEPETADGDHPVEVKEWNVRTPHTADENSVIDSANSVSAPWYDVMAVGLPPSVAYNWQFLMDLSAKLRTAPKKVLPGKDDPGPDRDNYNARLKYMLTKIQDMQAAKTLPVKLDTLKQKHLLKARLNGQTEQEDDVLAWAWRRAAHMQK